MAATVTVTDRGKGRYEVSIAETGIRDTSETTLAASSGTVNIPEYGRIISRNTRLTAGTGTTIDPIVGELTNPPTNTEGIRLENGTAAANTEENPAVERRYKGGGAGLFHRSRPNNAATDHSVTTVYQILAGWEPIR